MSTAPTPTSLGWRKKACVACTASKRQCDKQEPACRRCRSKGRPCQYPLVRQICLPIEDASEADEARASGTVSDVSLAEIDFLAPSLGDCQVPNPLFDAVGALVVGANTECAWFLSEATWGVMHGAPEGSEFVDTDVLQRFVADVQSWFRQWVTDGCNPFIHAQLYRQRMPRSVRDAYTSLTAYLAKNAANERMTLQVVQDNAESLLREQQPDDNDDDAAAARLDTLDHVARVQALLVYQAIRLFDGDIGARERGEAAAPTLLAWTRQMWARAKRDLRPAEHGATAAQLRVLGADGTAFVWRTWIVAESVRRTWLTARVLTGVYQTLKTGASECPGGIAYTVSRGLWDAPSAYAWARACRSAGPAPLLHNISSADALFGAVGASDVDDFSHAMMRATFGEERMERWVGETAEGMGSNPLDTMFLLGDLPSVA